MSEHRVYIGELPEATTKQEIRDALRDIESKLKLELLKRNRFVKELGERKRICFAFITFETEAAKETGLNALKQKFSGVKTADAAPKPAKPSKPTGKSTASPEADSSNEEGATGSSKSVKSAKSTNSTNSANSANLTSSTSSAKSAKSTNSTKSTKSAKSKSKSTKQSSEESGESVESDKSPQSSRSKPKPQASRARSTLEPVDDSVYIDLPEETTTEEVEGLLTDYPDAKVKLVRRKSRRIKVRNVFRRLPAKTFAIAYVGKQNRDKALEELAQKEIRGEKLSVKPATSRVRTDSDNTEITGKSEEPKEPKESTEPQEPKELKESKEPKDPKDSEDSTEAKEAKEAKGSNGAVESKPDSSTTTKSASSEPSESG